MGTSYSRASRRPSATDGDDIVVGVPIASAPAAAATSDVASAPAASDDVCAASCARKKLDLIFTMDVTGSMGSYIAAAKQGIQRITERLAQAEGYDLRYGLVAYRDHPPQDSSFVTKVFPFTHELSVMHQQLSTLSANGGGDGPEAVAAALKATLDAEWREDATKVSVLIADAPPHGLGESGDGFPDGGPDGVDPLIVLDQMSAKGITIYSVGCQPALSNYRYATEFFIACAERTNGQAVALGSADALADVILGASVEEMDLEKLTDEVQRLTAEYRSADPTVAEDTLQHRIWQDLRAQGRQTRHLGGARLQSKHATLVSAAATLSAAKTSLSKAGPPAPDRSLKGGLKTKAMPKRRGRPPHAMASKRRSLGDESDEDLDDESGTEAAASSASYALEERSISLEQVSRLYGKGKKMSLW